MAKNRTIDMGPPTENLPEWSMSSVTSDYGERKNVAGKPAEGAVGNSGLDAEFVLDGQITSPLRPDYAGIGGNDFAINQASAAGSGMQMRNSVQTSPQANTEIRSQVSGPSHAPQPDGQYHEGEKQTGYVEDPMKEWEKSEHALSEAAAMLRSISEEHAREEDGNDLQSLRLGLDRITASLSRMNASAQEDMADVIEQTQRNNELLEAIQLIQHEMEEAPEKINIGSPVVPEPAVPPASQPQAPQMSASAVPPASQPQAPQMSASAVPPVSQPQAPQMGASAVPPASQPQAPQMSASAVPPASQPQAPQMSASAVPPASQPETVAKEVEMKTLAPLDETETSGMDVDKIFELFQTPSSKSPEQVSKQSSKSKVKERAVYDVDLGEFAEPAKEKAGKKSSRRKQKHAANDEFESEVVLKDDLSGDGFQFVEDKGIVENPTEWTIDSSFQNGGSVTGKGEESMKAQTVESETQELITISGVEDMLKKRDVEVKRVRGEMGRLENSSGFAFALSDLK